MRYDVFVNRNLVPMMDELVVLLDKRQKHKGKALGLDLDVVESFHHFSARLHQTGQGDLQAFNGLCDRQSAGIDATGRQFRFQIFGGLGYRDVTCQAQKKLRPNFKCRDPESKGDIVPAVLHRLGQVGDPNQVAIGLKIDTGNFSPDAPEGNI